MGGKKAKKTKIKRHFGHDTEGRRRDLRWERLDNTALLFPVIADDNWTNTYRISVTLNEEIRQELLQNALNLTLPRFDGFNLRLRKGFFWYYFEENGKPAPRVRQENTYPCQFIVQNENRSYMFRVTYYGCRINLEVFHVLTDGMGGINFLKELTYQYLRLSHPEVFPDDRLSASTSLNREDSFLRNYRKSYPKEYKTQKSYRIRGDKLPKSQLGITHGYMPISQLKTVCKSYGLSINEYLVSAYVYSIYQECLHGAIPKNPIRVAVPVNLRPYFDSVTTKNFFVMVSAEFVPAEDHPIYTFHEVAKIIQESLRAQITKEHLERIFSYNVSNQMKFIARAVPLPLKNMGIKAVYTTAALANTSTVTNIGNITVEDAYRPYIRSFYAILAMSKGQDIKGTICSYDDTLTFTFSSRFCDAVVQRGFFRQLSQDGIPVELETNGVYYD